MSVSFSSMEYQVSESDGLVNIGVVFGETQSQVVVGLSTIPATASGWFHNILLETRMKLTKEM